MADLVLGIDAAWTDRNPSGFALVARDGSGWRVLTAAASHGAFHAACGMPGCAEPDGAGAVLASAARLGGAEVRLVAVDMPLARTPIAGRRVSDNLVSSVYGGRRAGTHSPNADRPGAVSTRLQDGCAAAGYPLLTEGPVGRGLIEVYPHPALIELTGAPMRLPYKFGKIGKYWRGETLSRDERKRRLIGQWQEIVARLETEMVGVGTALPDLDSLVMGKDFKAYEDALDAIVCAWVGICALEGRAAPLGDAVSAVWIPRSTMQTVGE